MRFMKEGFTRIAPFFVFIVLLASTIGAWRVTQNVVNAEVERNFNRDVQIIKHWMQDRLNLYAPLVLGMRIFFESSDKVTANEWSAYIRRLKLIDKYPAISSLIYIEWDKSKGENAYIVRYIEPLDAVNQYKEIVGFDISSDQERLNLFNSVRGEDPVSTGRVTLVTTPRKGFEIILPVYKKRTAQEMVEYQPAAFKGFILVEVAGSRLFQDIIDVVDSSDLSFEVYSSLPNKENLLYERGQDLLLANPSYKPSLTVSETFEFNGQTWYLVASAKPEFDLTPSQRRLPLIVLGSGVVVSFLFFGIYLSMVKRNRIAS